MAAMQGYHNSPWRYFLPHGAFEMRMSRRLCSNEYVEFDLLTGFPVSLNKNKGFLDAAYVRLRFYFLPLNFQIISRWNQF